MNLTIDVVDDLDKSMVNLKGEIDIYTAPKLKEALLPLTKVEGKILEINLDGVNYMDSTGLGVFISVLKSTRECNTHFKLINLQDRVLRLFTITGLSDIMDIHSLGKEVEVKNNNGTI